MIRSIGMRAAAALAVGLVALASTACGGSHIKPDAAAQSVVDLVSKKTDFTPTDVTCPDGLDANVGVEFDCSFTGPENTTYTAHMKVVQIQGEQVLFDINVEPTA